MNHTITIGVNLGIIRNPVIKNCTFCLLISKIETGLSPLAIIRSVYLFAPQTASN